MTSATMEPQLTQILSQIGVHDDIIQWMVNHDVITTNQFANYLEARNEVQTKILDQVTPQRGSPGQLARVKMAWRQAEAVCARGLDRLSAGGDIAPTDDPLDSGTCTTLEAAWSAFYKWPKLAATRMGNDNLLGRLHR